MVKFGIIKLEKRNIFTFLAAFTGLIGLYKYTLILGTVTIVFGLIARQMKSDYWTWAIFLGILVYVLYAIDTFWIGT